MSTVKIDKPHYPVRKFNSLEDELRFSEEYRQRPFNAVKLAEQRRMMSEEEVHLLHQGTMFCRNNPIFVNIGANVGTSSIAMLEQRPDAFVFSIDVKPHQAERENAIEAEVDVNRIVRILGDSGNVGRSWPFDVDLVFVDGAHHRDAVIRDIQVWSPLCRSVLFFHDYNHPNLPDLTDIVDDMIGDSEDWFCFGEERYLIGFARVSDE
jgi:hypothetical protein